MVKILVKKFDKNIKLPTYKTSGSSGMDLVAYIKNKITIDPGKTVMIPTGIAVAIPKNYDLIVDGSDNFRTRFLINDYCFKNKKILVSGAINKFE